MEEDSVRPKKTRRRRSRKKKGTNTVEGIDPNRAPIGFVLTEPESESTGDGDFESSSGHQSDPKREPHDIDSPFANLSVNPLIAEDQARIRSHSSNSTRPTKHCANYSLHPGQFTPTPSRHVHVSGNPTFLNQRESLNSNFGQLAHLSCSELRSRSAGTTPLSKGTLVGRNIPGEAPDLSIPMYNTRPAQQRNMPASGPSFSSQARAAELNAAAAARARNFSREVEDVNNISPARKVSLGPLSSRTHTVNGGPKHWRPFSFEEFQEASSPPTFNGGNNPSMIPAAQVPGPHRFDPVNPSMAPHPLQSVTDMESNEIQEHRNIPTRPSRQPPPYWLHEMNSHMQPNMLSSPGYYESANGNSFSPRQGQPAARPPPKAFVNLRGPPLLGPDDISPAKQEEKSKFRGLHDVVISRNPLQEDPFMPGQPYHPHGPPPLPFAPQPDLHIAYGYGPPVYSPQPGHVDMDYNFGSHNVRGENDRYVAYAPAPPFAPQISISTESQVYGRAGVESMVHTETMAPMKPPEQASSKPKQSPKAPEATAVQSSDNQPNATEKFDTKRVMTAYLNNVVEASKKNMEHSTRDRTVYRNEKLLAVPHRAKIPQPQGGLLFPHIDFTTLPSQQPTEVLSADLETRETVFAELTAEATFGKCPRVNLQTPKSWKAGSLSSKSDLGNPDTPSRGETNSAFKFPPPGLPFPQSTGPFGHVDQGDDSRPLPGSRLEQSHLWFHKDNRGDKLERARVAGITNQDSSRRVRERGLGLQTTTDDILTDASNVLLGGVLVNLDSYVFGDRKGYFAKFGRKPKSAFELRWVKGTRSFLDYNPSGAWGFPPRVSEQGYQQQMNGN